jgi:hypothetical protein
MEWFNVEDKQNLATNGKKIFHDVKVEVSKVDVTIAKARVFVNCL